MIPQLRNKENLLGTSKQNRNSWSQPQDAKASLLPSVFFSRLFLHCSFTLENCRNHCWHAFQGEKLGRHWIFPFHAVCDNENFQRT